MGKTTAKAFSKELQAMEFKIGDLVRGTQNQKYGIANADMTLAEVTGVYDGMVMIRVIKHKTRLDVVNACLGTPIDSIELIESEK